MDHITCVLKMETMLNHAYSDSVIALTHFPIASFYFRFHIFIISPQVNLIWLKKKQMSGINAKNCTGSINYWWFSTQKRIMVYKVIPK